MMLCLHTLLAATLLWTSFCRASITSKRNTVAPVRWAFAVLMAAAVVALMAPYVWGYQPDYMSVTLLAGIASVQVTTASYWKDGVPQHFRPKDVQHATHSELQS